MIPGDHPIHASFSRDERGFTLIELALVLVIVGILAAVGYGTFHSQLLRARRTEALVGLAGIQRSETAAYGADGQYADNFDQLGFDLPGARSIDSHTIQGRIYTFTVKALPYDGNPRGNFQALATGNLDTSDPFLDILLIENHLTILKP